MGANQSTAADDTDSEREEGEREEDEEGGEDEEELEQEPEVRPFEQPQQPLAPQDSMQLRGGLHPSDGVTAGPPSLSGLSGMHNGTSSVRADVNGHMPQRSMSADNERIPVASSAPLVAEPGLTAPPAQLPALALPTAPPPVSAPKAQTSPAAHYSSPPPLPPLSFGVPLSPRSNSLTKENTTEVYLIRHAEATNNVGNLIGGRSPAATLTPKGRRQAATLGRFLREFYGFRFDMMFSSPLERARSTAMAICQELGVPEDSVKYSDDLQELSQGEWEGKLRSDMYTQVAIGRINAAQPDFRAPGGESQRQVEFRMMEFLNTHVLGRDSLTDLMADHHDSFSSSSATAAAAAAYAKGMLSPRARARAEGEGKMGEDFRLAFSPQGSKLNPFAPKDAKAGGALTPPHRDPGGIHVPHSSLLTHGSPFPGPQGQALGHHPGILGAPAISLGQRAVAVTHHHDASSHPSPTHHHHHHHHEGSPLSSSPLGAAAAAGPQQHEGQGVHYQQQQQQQRGNGLDALKNDLTSIMDSSSGLRAGGGRVTRAAIVSHGTAIKCLLRGVLGSDPHMTHKMCIDNSSVTVLRHTPSRGWQLQRVNDTCHLLFARGAVA